MGRVAWRDIPGACYLRMVVREKEATALHALGLWPTVAELLQAPAEWFVDSEASEWLMLDACGCWGGHLEWLVDVGDRDVVFAGSYFVRCAKQMTGLGAGSYGARLRAEEDDREGALFLDVGLRIGGSCMPLSPVGSTVASMELMSYNAAVVAYWMGRMPVVCSKCGVDDGSRVSKFAAEEAAQGVVATEPDSVSGSGSERKVHDVGVRGPNYERNRARREEKKMRKQKRQAMNQDWRKGRGGVSPVRESVESVKCGERAPQGFWNSCSAEVRQELIDSKARRHIAENKRLVAEEQRKLDKLNSPAVILMDAMKMVDFANEQAKKANDSKVAGWAATVAESYAETVAKSMPSSMPSLESYVEGRSTPPSSVVDQAVHDKVVVAKEQVELRLVQLEEQLRVASIASDSANVRNEQLEAKLRQMEENSRDSSTTRFLAGEAEKQRLRLELQLAEKEIDLRYAQMGAYDPSMLRAEKDIVRGLPRFAKLRGCK